VTTAALDITTFVAASRSRARQRAGQMAFEFLSDDGSDGVTITYAALDARARAVAAALQQRGFGGERAVLLCPPGLDLVAALFGCLYAGCVAVPAYPPTRNQHLARLTSILRDAQPAVGLTTGPLLGRVQSLLSAASDANRLEWLVVDDVPAERGAGWQAPRLGPADLAILQYTSGSTGAPRGVMLSHANLLHNTRQIERRFEINPASRGVIWLPPFHDMGLIGGTLQGIQAGFPIALMSPASFLRRPARWLEAISSRQATISGGPNFAYELCL
jgi:acyl-CoA synthetase (AMP-forming)/AMP-acid ligase II